MSDLISRQVALEAVSSEPLYESGLKRRYADEAVPAIYEKIKALPSAQPEPICVAKITLTDEQVKEAAEKAKCEILTVLSAQPERNAQERYEDLCEYFKDCSDKGMSILGDRKEFKAWLERLHWHVVKCDELDRELDKLQSAQPEIIRCKDCVYFTPEKSGEHWNICRFYDAPKTADGFCNDAERKERETD